MKKITLSLIAGLFGLCSFAQSINLDALLEIYNSKTLAAVSGIVNYYDFTFAKTTSDVNSTILLWKHRSESIQVTANSSPYRVEQVVYSTTDHSIYNRLYENLSGQGSYVTSEVYSFSICHNFLVDDIKVIACEKASSFSFIVQSKSYGKETEKVDNSSQTDKKSSSENDTEASPDEESIPVQHVEIKPSFKGGDANTFATWVNAHLVYPPTAKKNGVQGRVVLMFTVDTNGSVKNVRVARSIDPDLDKEAVRVVSSSPKWTPGEQGGRKVRVNYTFPVIFSLR